MNKPTEAQVKEFWERYGFETLPFGSRDKFKRLPAIKYPDGTIHSDYPPIDLNNLFKYVVPLALDKMSWSDWFHFMVSWAIKLYDKKDPALALFWTLRQVEEKK